MKLNHFFLTTALLLSSLAAFSHPVNPDPMNKQLSSKTIVFIHGLFMNNTAWDEWKTYFEANGYTCYAPAHPKHNGNPTALRANPPAGLETVQFQDWISNLESFIDSLPEKPILIGHSFGGLTAQKLVESGRAEAAILISSAPPKGTFSFKPSFLRANQKVLNPFKGQTVFNPEESAYKKWFHSSIANSQSRAASDQLFEQFAVPESRVTHRAATSNAAAVNTQQPHVPLLFIGGLEDVIVPNELVRKTVKKYTDPNSIVDTKFYEGRDHMICATPGWEEVAEYCLEWLMN